MRKGHEIPQGGKVLLWKRDFSGFDEIKEDLGRNNALILSNGQYFYIDFKSEHITHLRTLLGEEIDISETKKYASDDEIQSILAAVDQIKNPPSAQNKTPENFLPTPRKDKFNWERILNLLKISAALVGSCFVGSLMIYSLFAALAETFTGFSLALSLFSVPAASLGAAVVGSAGGVALVALGLCFVSGIVLWLGNILQEINDEHVVNKKILLCGEMYLADYIENCIHLTQNTDQIAEYTKIRDSQEDMLVKINNLKALQKAGKEFDEIEAIKKIMRLIKLDQKSLNAKQKLDQLSSIAADLIKVVTPSSYEKHGYLGFIAAGVTVSAFMATFCICSIIGVGGISTAFSAVGLTSLLGIPSMVSIQMGAGLMAASAASAGVIAAAALIAFVLCIVIVKAGNYAMGPGNQCFAEDDLDDLLLGGGVVPGAEFISKFPTVTPKPTPDATFDPIAESVEDESSEEHQGLEVSSG